MSDQNLEKTMEMYDQFGVLADFVKTQATPDEVHAIQEVMAPLNEALAERLKEIGPPSWQN